MVVIELAVRSVQPVVEASSPTNCHHFEHGKGPHNAGVPLRGWRGSMQHAGATSYGRAPSSADGIYMKEDQKLPAPLLVTASLA